MNRHWTISACIAALLFAVNAEEDNVVIPTECPKVQSPRAVIHIAHEFNCTKFYSCAGGRKILNECPFMDAEGHRLQHFNAEKQVCDWPNLSGCTNKYTPMDEGDAGTDDIDGTDAGGMVSVTGATDRPSTVHPEESKLCPPDGSKNGRFYPHQWNCEKYYFCVESKLNVRQCSGGKHFNPKNNACDLPENVKCSPSTPEPSTTTLSSSTTEPSTTTLCSSTPEPFTTTQSSSTPEPSTTTQSSSTPEPSTTTLSSSTTEPSTTSQSSSTPLSVSISTKDTAPASSVTVPTPKPSECPNHNFPTQIPHETDCSLYYECNNRQKTLKRCVDGLKLNQNLGVCDWAEFESSEHSPNPNTGGCIGDCPLLEPAEVVHLPHQICTKFCKCSFGKPHLFTCPHHLHFNPEKQICDYPYQAGCKGQVGRLRE